MSYLTVDQVRKLRVTQDTWRAIAENPAIRLSARENAARNVATIEAQIRSSYVSGPSHAFHGAVSHG